MRRNVLFMISSLAGGGSERQTLLLLQHLDRTRFRPHLYLTHRSGDLLSEVPEDVILHSFEEAPTPGGLYYPGRVLQNQVRYLQQLLQRESIDVVYDRTFHMTMIAGPAARRTNVPRVSTIVSPPHMALPMVERRFVGLKRRRLATAYRHSQNVVAVSQQAADSAASYYGLPTGSVKVLRNPVDLAAIDQAATEPIARDDSLTLVCVGRMTEEKGHRDLIDAVAKCCSRWPADLAKPKLWLVGDGPLKNKLHQRVADHSLAEIVQWKGKMPSAIPAIAAADALVLPSLFEGLPNVVLEAMALNKPVIATRSGGTIELESDQPTVFWAQPGNVNSLTDAIMNFVTNRETANQHVLAARQLLHQNHDLRAAVSAIEHLLDGEKQ